jgi:DNA-directed RNA polymerase subunit beta
VRSGSDIYQLIKFKRSNQNTCINQKPIVRQGDRVLKGQVIADGPCTEQGELGLGRNVLVAFMPWRGYNFEDAILISEKLVREDYYTSVHIEEFEIEARDTKLGPEEITRDIPNVSEHSLRDLDESGIIRIGAKIHHNDILVGKVTPKGETQLTPEEKLLRAIFGEKAGDVRDASLTCPPGIEGTVVDVRIFSRKGQEKDERARQIEAEQIAQLEKNLSDEIRILTDERLKRLEGILGAKEVLADLHDERTNKRLLAKGAILDRDAIERISTRNLKRIRYNDKDPRVNEQIDEIEEMTSRQIDVLRKITNEKIGKLQKGDELAPGVIKLVKCYIAMKRKLSVGDKMAGRHGNKGVIARILPEEDMPYLPNGTPVEIVLNPLGVPSRMNVGQILETHLGWAAHDLGQQIAALVKKNQDANEVRKVITQKFANTAALRQLTELDDDQLMRVAAGMKNGIWFGTAVFDGAREGEIKALLTAAGLPDFRQNGTLRRHDRRSLRAAGHRGLHLYVEALPPGRRQNPRALHRPLLAHHPAAAGRQSAVRRAALRRNGSLGAGSLRRRLHPPGAAHRQVRRRLRPHPDLRSHRQGRSRHRARRARILQRAHPRAAVALPRR